MDIKNSLSLPVMEYIHWEKRYHILFSSRQPFIYLDKNIQCKQRKTTDRRSGLQTNPVKFKAGLNPFFITLGNVVMITSPFRNSQFIKHKKVRTRKLRNPGVTGKAGKYIHVHKHKCVLTENFGSDSQQVESILIIIYSTLAEFSCLS